MYFMDYWYVVLVIPAIILGMYAQRKVNKTFKQFSSVGNSKHLTAAQVARQILDRNQLYHVKVEQVSGHLTDHYDPRSNVIRLSNSVYDSTSVASIGVAAHEVGHAIQHATAYAPLKLRNAIIPITQFGSNVGPIMILLGFMIYEPLIPIGIILFAGVAFFQLVTLPVEYNASNRALATLENDGILNVTENAAAKKVLSAAALTYVAALVMALANLLRLILIYQGRRDND
ncbi:MAG: zinc metallopeptidase [Evtepia sp.]